MIKSSVTIGIPAYNEERNIAALLRSIFSQKRNSYKLESIIVVCDGCTDKTVDIVGAFAKKNKQILRPNGLKQSFSTNRKIKLIVGDQRRGKAIALNRIYALNKSDYLLTIDADIVLETDKVIDLLVKAIQKDPSLNIVGPRHVPVYPPTLMGKFAYVSYLSFEDAFLKLDSGNNFYAVMTANLIRKEFSKSFKYPKGTISDQNYLYAMATKDNRKGFKFVRNARVLFSPVSTFMDWRILGVRSVSGDKEDAVKHFGEEILEYYSMPKKIMIQSLIKWFLKSPVYTLGSVLMNLYVRMFPYEKVKPKDGKWELATSSKQLIKLT